MKKSKPRAKEPNVTSARDRKPPVVKRSFGTVLPTTNIISTGTSNNGKNIHGASRGQPSSATHKKSVNAHGDPNKRPDAGGTTSKPLAAEKKATMKDRKPLTDDHFTARPSVSKVTTMKKSAASSEKKKEKKKEKEKGKDDEIRKPVSIGGRRSFPLKEGEEEAEEVISTPANPKKRPVAVESKTPYHSAKNCSNCSNCSLDGLETASYWITQIKLAESVGKHSVSAAFFRLAFECHAQPSRSLRIELRSYADRHSLPSGTWTEVRRLYGLLGEKPGGAGPRTGANELLPRDRKVDDHHLVDGFSLLQDSSPEVGTGSDSCC